MNFKSHLNKIKKEIQSLNENIKRKKILYQKIFNK